LVDFKISFFFQDDQLKELGIEKTVMELPVGKETEQSVIFDQEQLNTSPATAALIKKALSNLGVEEATNKQFIIIQHRPRSISLNSDHSQQDYTEETNELEQKLEDEIQEELKQK
jgi:hypothetical protein